jgi:Arrestin (or S-antigen), N-terminal domain/Arrestin (or S-antigen), C-terminal domain
MTATAASIAITLNSSSEVHYESGETIEGRIHLYIPDTAPSTALTTNTSDIDSVFNHIELSLVGEELIDIGYHDHNDKYVQYKNISIRFLDYSESIYKYPSSTTTALSTGRYEFPFTIRTPQGLPSSFESHPDNDNTLITSAVRFTLSAHHTCSIASHNVTSRCKILFIRPYVEPAPCSLSVGPVIEPINVLFQNTGDISLSASIDKAVLAAYTSSVLCYSITNTSMASIQSLSITVNETCTVKKLSQRYTRALFSRVIESDHLFTNKSRSSSVSTTNSQNKDIPTETELDASSKRTCVYISLPANLTPSYRGSLLRIEHEIVLELRVSMKSSPIVVRIPILAYLRFKAVCMEEMSADLVAKADNTTSRVEGNQTGVAIVSMEPIELNASSHFTLTSPR